MNYITLITATTALLAVVISPCVQLYIAERQIKASTVATFRQKWIDELRDEIASFIGEWSKSAVWWQNHQNGSGEEKLNHLQSLARYEAKIALLINPRESDHVELVELLHAAVALAGEEFHGVSSQEIMATLDEARERIVAKSQVVLKREWNRVKIGR